MSSPKDKTGGRRSLGARVKKALATIAAIALGTSGLVLGSTVAAQAAGTNPNVVVSDVWLSDLNGDPLTDQLTVGDQFVIQGSWDATDADPQPGETFVIGLPGEFEFVMGGPPIKLMGDDPVTGQLVEWASCEPDQTTGDLTCTFTNIVAERDQISGVFLFDVVAAVETTETEVVFDLNGVPGVVVLPGEGGIDDGIDLPDEVTKAGVMNANNWSMTWTVDVPGASLVAAGGSVAHITDTLGAGHVLCSPIGLAVHTVRGDQVTNVTDLATITAGEPGDSQFSLDLNAPTGGFDSGVTYRISYQTCTPDGKVADPDAEFSNDAQIEGWGEAGHGVGTAKSRPWHINFSKSGSVLGGADRNGKIRWTLVVPGNDLAGDASFTLSDVLDGTHQVGADTISGITVREQYGPNPGNTAGLNQDITGQLNATTVSSSNTAFEVRFDIADTAAFEFKPSDWRYIITYDTYVTSPDLPEGGVKYDNTATVAGKIARGTAEVPSRTYSKTGHMNDRAKTLDGVEHSAFTTLDWRVTVPGQNVHGVSSLVLTDAPSATHQVCEAGDPTAGVKARLGLKVSVADQIQNGGKTPPLTDLTDYTTAELVDGEIVLTITQPNGQIFDRDFQYIITYTTCTSSGGIDARGTEYMNTIKGAGVDRAGRYVMNYGGSGTGTGVAKGSIGITKTVTGAGASLVADDTMFTVQVREFAPGATTPEETYTLSVPLNGDPINGRFQRGNGWRIELSEPTFPSVPGVSFGAPRFAEAPGLEVSADGTTAVATITPKTNVAVALTNTANLGQLSVTKKLEGPAASQVSADTQYQLTAQIDVSSFAGVPAQADRTFTLGADETTVLTNLPIGARVTITEVRPTDDDMFTWAAPVVSPESVTITADNVATPAVVTVTNSVQRTVGTFSLNKLVTGAQADNPAVPDTVTVTASWQQAGDAEVTTKELALPTDGTPIDFGEDLLIGTTVTLVETPLVDGSSIAWAAPAWSGTGVSLGDNNTAEVTIGRDADAHVTLTNHAATSTAGISLIKVVTGEAASDVPDDTEFSVTASWIDENDDEQSIDLMINALEPTPLGVELPAGTVVTLAENDRPEIATVVWGSIEISGEDVTDNGDGTAQIIVSDQQSATTLVSVTNESTWAAGTFALTKNVEGVLLTDPEVPTSVDVIATWNAIVDGELVEQTKTISVPTDGTAVDFGERVAAFTEVTLVEVAPECTDRFTWAPVAWAGDDYLTVNNDGSVTLIVQPAGAHEVALTNTAVATLGSIELTKVLSGTGAALVAKDTVFVVTAEWTDLLGEAQKRTLEVSANAPVVLSDVPFGTEVTLTENEATSPADATWKNATWSTDDDRVTLDALKRTATVVVTGEAGEPVALVLDNAYDENEKLATTGGSYDLVAATGSAAVMLGVGLAIVLITRRRTQRA